MDLLTALTAPQAAPRAFLAQLLPFRLRGRLDASGPPQALCGQAIEICLHSDYELDPPAMEGIVQALIQAGIGANSPTLVRIQARLAVRPPASPHPLDAAVLSNRLPFADRAPLRAKLRDMCNDLCPTPILAIGGISGSGRSHSAELVRHYCFSKRDNEFYQVHITKDNANDSGPKEIAADLVTQLGGAGAEAPLRTSNNEAWCKELANWVISCANKPETRKVWIVLDGFERGLLREDAFPFVDELQRLFTLGVASRRHRLLFCGFSDDVIAKVGANARTYVLEPITKDHIAALIEIIIDAQPQIPVEERSIIIEKTLELVLSGQPLPLESLTVVGKRLFSTIQKAGI